MLKLSLDFNVSNIVRNIASLIVFGSFAFGAFYATRAATDYLLDTAKLGSFLLHRFLSMLLFVYFLSINVGNIIVSYATFYRSPEMTYYLTKPVSYTNLFLIKFFDNFFYSSTAFFLIALAVLFGYGSHFHMSWLFYLKTMFLMLLPFMLISGCLAVILLLIIVRFAAVIGIRKIIVSLVIIYLGSVSFYFTLTSPLKLVARVLQHYPNLDQYFGYLDPQITKYLPNYWIAESLYWTMRGETAYANSYTILLLLLTVLIFGLMSFIGKSIFYQSWLASLNFGVNKTSHSSTTRIFSFFKPPIIDSQLSVLWKKEFWQFVREPSQWIHLSVISLLILTFLGSISNINLKQNMPFLQTVSYIVVLIFNAFLIASITLRFVFPSISIEGSNFWIVLSAPVKRSKVFWLKYFIWFVPIIFLSELLVIFSHRSLFEHFILVQAASLIMLGVAIAFVGLNLGAGTYFSNFKEQNPIRAASSQSATLTFLISIVYLTIIVAVIFIPLNGYFGWILKGIPFNQHNLNIATIFVLVISIIVGVISLLIGFKSLKRDY